MAPTRRAFVSATLAVATLGLMVACFKYPLAMPLKATVQDVLRQELARYEPPKGLGGGVARQAEGDGELIKRCEGELVALRDGLALTQTNHLLLLDISRCLCSLETNLDLLKQEFAPGGR